MTLVTSFWGNTLVKVELVRDGGMGGNLPENWNRFVFAVCRIPRKLPWDWNIYLHENP